MKGCAALGAGVHLNMINGLAVRGAARRADRHLHVHDVDGRHVRHCKRTWALINDGVDHIVCRGSAASPAGDDECHGSAGDHPGAGRRVFADYIAACHGVAGLRGDRSEGEARTGNRTLRGALRVTDYVRHGYAAGGKHKVHHGALGHAGPRGRALADDESARHSRALLRRNGSQGKAGACQGTRGSCLRIIRDIRNGHLRATTTGGDRPTPATATGQQQRHTNQAGKQISQECFSRGATRHTGDFTRQPL